MFLSKGQVALLSKIKVNSTFNRVKRKLRGKKKEFLRTEFLGCMMNSFVLYFVRLGIQSKAYERSQYK
jgi:hypothetical protein